MPNGFDGAAAGDVVGIAVTLALTFVLGLEREESAAGQHLPIVAGVRTVPIVGLLGHVLVLIAAGSFLPFVVGFAVIGGFLIAEYHFKMQHQRVGVTTELTALVAYCVGALVASGRMGVASTVTVATVLLLTGKQPLRAFAAALPRYEITTFVTFLLLAAVILPVLPNQPFTRFNLNPFQAWLVVVAVSGISYASYLLQKVSRSEDSLLLTALLGGLYSSTATTVAIARQSEHADPQCAAGGIILASGTMYVRILVLVWIFSADFGRRMAPALLGLAAIGSGLGMAMILVRRGHAGAAPPTPEVQHPLEIRAAVAFAALYLGLGVGTQLTAEHLGSAGLLVLAGLVGLTDIVPFILGLVGNLGSSVTPDVAVAAIMISIASNNLVKGAYAFALANRRTGALALAGLIGLAILTAAAGWIGV
jgi:uncharacterized membrane protein (DUF4010 family)